MANGKVKSKTPILLPVSLPTQEEFANKIGVAKSTLDAWAKAHEEFSEALTRAGEIQEYIITINAMSKLYDPRFAQFYLQCKHKMRIPDEDLPSDDGTDDMSAKEKRELLQKMSAKLKIDNESK